MATQSRNPTSDTAVSGTWTGSAGTRYTLVDDYPDSGGVDKLTHGTTAGYIVLGFSAFSIPAGSTAITVAVKWYDQKTSTPVCNIRSRLRVGGSDYNAASSIAPATSITARSQAWATNPRSAAAWTVDDINGVGGNALTGVGWYSTDASPTINLTSIQIEVTYTPDTNDELVASPLTSGIPTLAQPAITQDHVLTASPLTGGVPELGTPVLAEEGGDDVLEAAPLSAGIPTLGQPALTQDHVLTGSALAAGIPALGNPALAQNHALAATALTSGTPALGEPALGQNHALAATTLASSAPSLGNPALSQIHALIALTLAAGIPTLGGPTLMQDHVLTAAALGASAPTLGTPALAQDHKLLGADLLSGIPTLGTPVLTEGGTNDALIAADLTSGTPVLGKPKLHVTGGQINAFGRRQATCKPWQIDGQKVG